METEHQHSPVNIGNPHEISVQQLAAPVIAMTGSRSRISYLPFPQDDPTQHCPDITVAQDKLGWQSEVALEEGLNKAIVYFDSLLKADRL